MSRANLVKVYSQGLSALFLAAETESRRPLTEKECLAIRDSATVVFVPVESAAEMDKQRGYKDINPDNCWEEWQILRKRL